MARRRRRGLSYLPSQPRRTPVVIYIVLAVLFFGGIFYAKQGMVKPVAGRVIDAYTNQPITDSVKITLTNDPQLATAAGVAVNEEATTDSQGRFNFKTVTSHYELAAHVSRYRSVLQPFSNTYNPTLNLEPAFLQGVVHDQAGNPIAKASVVMGGHVLQTGAGGDFVFGDTPEQGEVVVKAIGFERAVVPFSRKVSLDVTLTPFRVKGVYVPAKTANDPYGLHNILNLLDTTEVNTVVLDIKDESGYVSYDSSVQFATAAPATKKYSNIGNLIQQLHQHHAYVIGRLVLFQDPVLTDKKSDWTLKSKSSGQRWADAAGYNWINPYNQDSWKYYLGLATEAAKQGFDEVQFDYDRFPTSGNLSDINYGQPSDETSRLQATTGFIRTAQESLTSAGVFVSVTAFGLTTVEPQDDLGIGQKLDSFTQVADYVSPTIYPDEWGKGAFGFDQPAQHPFELVGTSLHDSLQYVINKPGLVRPWLEAYNPANLTYGPNEIKGEVQAAGKENAPGGWLLWNPEGQYDVGDFQPKSASTTQTQSQSTAGAGQSLPTSSH